MASSYTANSGIEKPGSGEQAGSWGATTNNNFDIIDAGLHDQTTITCNSGTAFDLETIDGTVTNGMNKVILLTGTPGASFELEITPTDQKKNFIIKNGTNQTCTVVYKGVTPSSSNSVSIAAGVVKEVTADGGGSSGVVTELFNNKNDLVDDTTPQLGGDLDANSNDILMGGQSLKFGTSKWEVVLDSGDNDLLFKYNGTTVLKIASNGSLTSAQDITGFGSP